MEKICPDGLSHPNQNIIIINNVVAFYMIWKNYNEIQLTKNKVDLNNRKMTNHGNSNRKHTAYMLHRHL